MSTDLRDTIAGSPMSRLQILAVAITIALNALDGFDVLAISFASPGIAAEWHLANTALGVVLSMELIGMAIGSIALGGVADLIGRRPTILGCLAMMALGMFMVTTTSGLVALSAWRVLTGFGIGGMLAAINAVAAEFSNARRRNLNVSLMAIGYPLGGVAGGLIVTHLLGSHGWRSIFYFGATVTAICLPLVYALVPESVHWLARKQPLGALERINQTLRRMGHAAAVALPAIASEVRKRATRDLFAPGLLSVTLLVTAAYFFHIITFYFILKWVPKLVVNMGFKATSASAVLVWTNVGGATGGAMVGLLAQRFGLKPLTIGAMLLSTVMVILFGRSPPDLTQLALICACAGFATNATIVGMYAIFAQAFPTHVRASGTGFAVGVGRGGSVLAPIIAGFLLDQGLALPRIALIMSIGSLVAAIVLSRVQLRGGYRDSADEGHPAAELPVAPGAATLR